MNSRLSPALALPFAVALLIGAALPSFAAEGPKVATPIAGTPLLDLQIRSFAATAFAVPLCGLDCFNVDPTIVWFHATLLADGNYSGGLTTRKLASAEGLGVRSDLFSGRLAADQIRGLRQKLAEAHIGEQSAPCAVALRWTFQDPQSLNFGVRRLTVDGEISWFGPRRTLVVGLHGEEQASEPPRCPEPLKSVILDLVELAGRRP